MDRQVHRRELIALALLPALAFALAGCDTCSGGAVASRAPDAADAAGSGVVLPRTPAATGPKLHGWPAAGAGRHPAIVLLHGAAGPGLFTDATSDHRRYPEQLAAAGYAVFMPYYAEERGDALEVATLAFEQVRTDPSVDPSRVAVVGFSRGANLALRLGVENAHVAAVVEFYGWLSGADAAKMTRMPPTLILHGAKDTDVKVDEAYKLEGLFRAKKVEYELLVYPEGEHGFGRAILPDSITRAITFLDAHLRADAAH